MGRLIIAASAAALLASGVDAAIIDSGGGQYVWTDVVGSFSPVQPNSSPGSVSVIMDMIDPLNDIAGFTPGSSLIIVNVGIGGDSDSQSGDNRFRLVSDAGSADFTWVAGQQSTPATYRLNPTASLTGVGHGFSYQSVSYALAPGEGFSVSWDYRFDYDGQYTLATDILGNEFDDSALRSSIRAWVQFEIEAAPVPAPASGLLLIGALAALAARRRQRSS